MRNDEVEATREYHRRTSHSRAEVQAGGSSPEWSNQPRPYKLYPRLEPIPLPPPTRHFERSALDAVASSGLGWDQVAAPSVATLATVLHYSAGIIRRLTLPKSGKELAFRAASCTGALYHLDVYVVAGPLDGLNGGVYQFGPQDHALRLLRPGDWRAALTEACANQPWVARAPLSLILTTTYWRNGWRYGERAYRHAFWDSGTMLANVLALAPRLGLPAGVITGFVDRTVNRLLDLDAQREVALVVVPLGRSEEAPPAPPGPIQVLGLRTAVYSASEADFPAIRTMHTASSLSRPEEVSAWREIRHPLARCAAPMLASTEGGAAPLPDLTTSPTSSPSGGRGGAREAGLPLSRARERGAGGEGSLTIEACIEARGSARRFRRTPISSEALGTVLWAATRGFGADYRTSRHDVLVECLLLVSEIDGLEPGLHRYQPGRGAVAHLATLPDPRALAGRLVLDEQRGADAAVLLLLMADLTTVLGRLGNRGYRAAQLEAGIVAGKLYLAATEVGLGVTGLTFYDDEVTGAVEPHAPGLTPMLVVALGQPGQPQS